MFDPTSLAKRKKEGAIRKKALANLTEWSMELVPEDFGRMRRLLADWMAGYEDRGAGERLKKRQMLVIQEGGYKLDDIPAAAQAFWTGGKHAG